MKSMFSIHAHKCLAACLIAGGLLTSNIGFAQEFKIGFVSTERIFREANMAKASQAKLEQEFAKREKDLQAISAQIKAGAEKLEKEGPTMSESSRVARQRQLMGQDQELQRKQREFQEDLNLRKNEELQHVLESANRIIKQVAIDEKYDLILQEAVYVNPKHDITEKIIQTLNAKR